MGRLLRYLLVLAVIVAVCYGVRRLATDGFTQAEVNKMSCPEIGAKTSGWRNMCGTTGPVWERECQSSVVDFCKPCPQGTKCYWNELPSDSPICKAAKKCNLYGPSYA